MSNKELIRLCQDGDENGAEILLLSHNSDGLSEKMVKELNEILKGLGIKPNKFNPKTKKIELIREKIKESNFEDLDPDFQDSDGWTALMYASHHGHKNCVEVLLEYGSSPGVRNGEGKTAFDVAEIDEIKNIIGGPLLILACKEGDEDETEKLLPYGIDFNVRNRRGYTALMGSSKNGHENIVELLLQHDVNINRQNRDGYTALILASKNGHENIVELLLQHDADVNLYVKNLVKRRDFFDPGHEKFVGYKCKTALMFACKNDHEKCVELLLQHGADPNLRDENGRTLLILASEKGRDNIVQILLQYDPDIEVMDDKHFTALMAACSRGRDKCAEILLKHGADPNVEDGDEYTALMKASINNHEKCVELLLQHDADPDIQYRSYDRCSGFSDYDYYDYCDYGDEFGRTALMFACKKGHENIVEILLGYGANADIKNDRDETAFDLARTDEIRDIIRQGGLPGPKGAVKK